MIQSNRLTPAALRGSAASFAIALAVLSAPASAQTAASESTADSEVIIVTGSRIARPDLESTAPVAVVSSAEIALKGAVNVEEIMYDMPQVIPSTNAASNNPGGGVATIDLRGLGASRTLVLVNGRRWLSYDVGQIVDINTVPAQLIERVEVVTGGRSAVYGSDAIAGVVNFALKKDFEGIEIDTQYRITEKGDGGTWGTSVLFGSNFADGRGNVTLFGNYTRRNAIMASERWYTNRTLSDNGDGTVFFGGSGTGNSGRLNFGSGWQHINGDGSLRPFTTADQFNYAPDNYLQVPQERWMIGGFANYEVNEHLDFYTEVAYVNNRVVTQLAASPVTFTGAAEDRLTIHTYSPFLAPATQAYLQSLDTDGDGYVVAGNYGRRAAEVGARISEIDRQAFRTLIGVRGEIAAGWRYDGYYSFARTTSLESQYGNVSRSRMHAGVTTVFRDPSSGATSVTPLPGYVLSCRDGAPAGCVPVNIFGAGNISNDAASFIAVDTKNQDIITDQVASLAVTNGELFNLGLGADSVGVVVGTEWRSTHGRFAPDFILSSGDVAGFNAGQPTEGGYNVVELFGEVSVPILADLPFAHRLEVNGAARYSDYSNNVGSAFSWSVGGSWAPIRDITFRGGYQRAIRAPTVSALYLGNSEGFPGFTDYCTTDAATTNASLRASCLANGFPAANLGDEALGQAQVRAIYGGNPDLEEETADSWTVGAVVQPGFAPGLSLTVDYYQIKIKNAILSAGPGVTNVRDACFGTDSNGFVPYDASFCDYISRDSAGEITSILNTNLNAGFWKTRGVDFELAYGLPLGFGILGAGDSRLNFRLSGTRLIEFSVNNLAAIPDLVVDCAGLYGAYCGVPYSKWRGNASVAWSTGPAVFQLRGNYVGPSDDDGLSGYDEVYTPRIGGYVTFDLSAAMTIDENLSLRFGINNLGNKMPPLLGDANAEQSNTFPTVYDTLGRRFFMGVTAKF